MQDYIREHDGMYACGQDDTAAGAWAATSRIRDETGYYDTPLPNSSLAHTAFFIYAPPQLGDVSVQEPLKYRPHRLVDLRGNPLLTLAADDSRLARHSLIGVQGDLGHITQGAVL